jgi:hypothetical protein
VLSEVNKDSSVRYTGALPDYDPGDAEDGGEEGGCSTEVLVDY